MVRVALLSPDSKLPSVLSSALQPEYRVVSESKDRLKQESANPQSDVIVLDFDSNYSNLAEQLAIYDELSWSPTPIVVMTDDPRRSSAIEFLQRGAFDCIRKPPSL